VFLRFWFFVFSLFFLHVFFSLFDLFFVCFCFCFLSSFVVALMFYFILILLRKKNTRFWKQEKKNKRFSATQHIVLSFLLSSLFLDLPFFFLV